MEYQKETLKTMKVVSRSDQTQNYDWDIIVPDSKPDVASIISTDGTVNITGREIMQDRAVINGNVRINILYISQDAENCVKSIESVQNFNYVLELKDLRQNMTLDLYSFVNKISSNVLNSRKINIYCVLDFFGTAYGDYEVSYIDKIDEENVKCLTKDIKTLKMTDCFESCIPVNENLEIPVGKASISELLKIKSEFAGKEVKIANKKIVLRGNIKVLTAYLSDSDTDAVQCITNEIPVNEVIDCEKLTEDSVMDCDIEINNFNYILKNNSDGEKRIIKICGDIVVKGKIYEEIGLCPVTDAYSLCNNISLEQNKFEYENIINKLSGQFSFRDSIEINNKKDIQKIILTDISSEVDSVTNLLNCVKIKGMFNVSVLYSSTDGEICSVKNSLPFEQNVNVDGATDKTVCDLKLEIDSYSYNIISSDELEIRINPVYKLRVKECISQEIVQEIKTDGNLEKSLKHGITVVFCNGEESLWDVAKSYHTTVEDIMLINDMENQNEIRKGMKLLIP